MFESKMALVHSLQGVNYERSLCCSNDPHNAKFPSHVAGIKIDEVFLTSRVASATLQASSERT
jgi:aconitase B